MILQKQPHFNSGKLIAIEGIDGAGKSTLAQYIVTYLQEQGHTVIYINRYMLPELTQLWFRLVEQDIADQEIGVNLAVADYFIGLQQIIYPALSNGGIVLADRYFYSHLVFFGSRSVDIQRFKRMFSGARVPDIIFYVSISVDEALSRLRPKSKPNFWEAGLDLRLAARISEAYVLYQKLPADQQRQLVEQHFLEHQPRLLELYPEVLPSSLTCSVDGRRPSTEQAQLCIQKLKHIFTMHGSDS